jgi:hypothetical protein
MPPAPVMRDQGGEPGLQLGSTTIEMARRQ